MQSLRLQGTRRELVDGAGEVWGNGRFGEAEGSAGQVSVAVDESRHDDAAAGVDEIGLPGESEILDTAARSDVLDATADDEDRSVRYDCEVSKVSPAAGAWRSAQCKELSGTADQNRFRHPRAV